MVPQVYGLKHAKGIYARLIWHQFHFLSSETISDILPITTYRVGATEGHQIREAV